jgi:hypothetical protein
MNAPELASTQLHRPPSDRSGRGPMWLPGLLAELGRLALRELEELVAVLEVRAVDRRGA